jgi:hypothetical protein
MSAITWYRSEDFVTGMQDGVPVVQIERLSTDLWEVVVRVVPISVEAFSTLGAAKAWATRQVRLVGA